MFHELHLFNNFIGGLVKAKKKFCSVIFLNHKVNCKYSCQFPGLGCFVKVFTCPRQIDVSKNKSYQ